MRQFQKISAQISLYPLGSEQYNSAIDEVLSLISSKGIPYEINAMATLLTGEPAAIFSLLSEINALLSGASQKYVMNVTLSNTCGCEL